MLHLSEVLRAEIYARNGIVVKAVKRGKEVLVRKLPSLHGGARGGGYDPSHEIKRARKHCATFLSLLKEKYEHFRK